MSDQKYPAPGHVYEMDFGDFAFLFDYHANGKDVTFKEAPSAKPMGIPEETVSYTAIAIRPHVFMVHWVENNRATVVHIEDFEKGVVYTNCTLPDMTFLTRKGTLRKIR